MIPCAVCKRHLRNTEQACPFCGAEVRSSWVSAASGWLNLGAFAFSTLALLGTTACAKDGTASEADTTTNATTNATTVDDTSESGMTETETDTSDSSNDTNNSTGSFYAVPEDDFSSLSDCDPFAQDCPDGEKCVPYASTGGTWDANKCVPVTGADGPGDPCTSNGIIEASDTCDETSVCFFVEEVDGELVGVCTEFCTGFADEPVCPESSTCVIANDGSLNLCVQACDPLAQDCPLGLGCYWLDDEFGCASPAADPVGEPCSFISDCAAGSLCVEAEFAPDCGDAGCCVAFCSLTEPSCSPDTECVAFFEGEPPAGYEDVGLCLVPG
jgi:hypothetical protein